jgi:hypothetical protein
MKSAFWTTTILIAVATTAIAAETDWSLPAPQAEIERANNVVAAAFGKQLFSSSVYLVSSGSINSGGNLTGYFVCYHFSPRSANSAYSTICVERALSEEYSGIDDQLLPTCDENIANCGVEVSAIEAVDTARKNGFNAPATETTTWLHWYPEYETFAWRVDLRAGGSCVSENNRFIVSASTGEVLAKPRN